MLWAPNGPNSFPGDKMQLSIIVSPKYERNISSSLTKYVRKKEIITVQNINNKKIEISEPHHLKMSFKEKIKASLKK